MLGRGASEAYLRTCSSRSISAQLGSASLAVLARTGKGTFVRYRKGGCVKAGHTVWSAHGRNAAVRAPQDIPGTQLQPQRRKARRAASAIRRPRIVSATLAAAAAQAPPRAPY